MPSSLESVRALWFAKQALDGSSKAPLAKLIGRSGWLRTLGGTDVYLAARARRPGMKRAELDVVVAKGELRVVPAVRGCIYLVPGAMVPDLMALNAEAWLAQTKKELAKIGKTMKVVEAVAPKLLDALAAAPLDTNGLRKQVEVAGFGDAGKKVGLSSPLPLALRLLELDGRIERTLDGGRLDTDRYLWRKAVVKAVTAGGATSLANVVGAFLDFAGPVTLAQLSAWSGRPQRDLKPIVGDLAKPVAIDGVGDAWASDLAALSSAPAPKGVALLAFEDNYLVNHGGLAVVTDPKHHALKVDIWGGSKPEAIGEADHVLSRTILVDGMVAGFWEVDPRSKGAVWHTFDTVSKAVASTIDELTRSTAAFLLDELGTAKVFTLDTMEEVQARADRIVKLKKK